MANSDDQTVELLQTLLIVMLAQAGVPQKEIKSMLGLGSARVNQVAKYIKRKNYE